MVVDPMVPDSQPTSHEGLVPTTLVPLQSPLLAPYAARLRHGFTGRPLPIGGQRLDDAERAANRRSWCEAVGIAHPERLAVPSQVHGDTLLPQAEAHGQAADGVLIDGPGRPALVQVADCVPILLYAPDAHVGAVVHAGWRGTAQSIAPKAVQALADRYGADPEWMVAVLGPAIGMDAYEVGWDVVEALRKTLSAEDGPVLFYSLFLGKKPHVDVRLVNFMQLSQAGLQHIEVTQWCTFYDQERFWSHRRGDWQRQGLLLELLP